MRNILTSSIFSVQVAERQDAVGSQEITIIAFQGHILRQAVQLCIPQDVLLVFFFGLCGGHPEDPTKSLFVFFLGCG